MRNACIAFVSAVLLAAAAQAAEHCQPSDTVRQCVHRFLFVLPDESDVQKTDAAASAAKSTQKAVSAVNTGITNLLSPSQTALKDFLSLLSVSGEKGSAGDAGTPLTFDYNLPVSLFGEGYKLKLQTVLAKPDLSSDLTSRLTGNDAAVTSLKNSFSYSDDITTSATLNPSSQRFGRSIAPHRAVFEDMLVSLFNTDPQADQRAGQFFKDAGVSTAKNAVKNFDSRLDALIPDASARGKVIADLEASAQGAAFTDAVAFAKNFTALLNNQPQLYGSALYHSRKDIAGANERSAKLTYEMGRHNLNEFYGGAGHDCAPGMTINPSLCATALNKFAQTTGAADSTDRVAVSVEYNRTDPVTVTLPQFSVDYSLPSGHKLVYSITYGRTLAETAADMMKEDRLDVAINYEDTKLAHASDNVPLRIIRPFDDTSTATPPPRDRFVGSITYTHKINDNFALPLSLVYANHASFLPGDVTRKLNAHFGLVYKLPSSK